jgi:hypothetical protein
MVPHFALFLILIVNLLGSAESIEVDCGIREDPANRKMFEDFKDYLNTSIQVCGFKIDGSKNSIEINFYFPVDGNTGYVNGFTGQFSHILTNSKAQFEHCLHRRDFDSLFLQCCEGGENSFPVKAISALKVFTIAAILFILVLILIKMMRLQNSRLNEFIL